jgi:hypothetical protein
LGEQRRDKILKLVKSQYCDFGPTLAAEHLGKEDGIAISKETLRRVLIDAGVLRAKRTGPRKHMPGSHDGPLSRPGGRPSTAPFVPVGPPQLGRPLSVAHSWLEHDGQNLSAEHWPRSNTSSFLPDNRWLAEYPKSAPGQNPDRLLAADPRISP